VTMYEIGDAAPWQVFIAAPGFVRR
jgi:hypothetical protein